MKRTTIVADESLLLELKHRAKKEGRTVSELVRKVLEEYLKRSKTDKKLSFIGAGRSGKRNISEKSEEILEQAFKRSG